MHCPEKVTLLKAQKRTGFFFYKLSTIAEIQIAVILWLCMQRWHRHWENEKMCVPKCSRTTSGPIHGYGETCFSLAWMRFRGSRNERQIVPGVAKAILAPSNRKRLANLTQNSFHCELAASAGLHIHGLVYKHTAICILKAGHRAHIAFYKLKFFLFNNCAHFYNNNVLQKF